MFKAFASAFKMAVLLIVFLALGASTSSPTLAAVTGGSLTGKPAPIRFVGTTQFKAAVTGSTPAVGDPQIPPDSTLRLRANRTIPGRNSSRATQMTAAAPTVTAPYAVATAAPLGLLKAEGINGYDYVRFGNRGEIEPPDQALCASAAFVVEGVNLAVRVYGADLKSAGRSEDLWTLFAVPPADFVNQLTWMTDPNFYFDVETRRFFMTILTFDMLGNFSSVRLAVSQTANPLLGWNIYEIDTTDLDAAKPGCPCMGDQPLIGADDNGFYISTNEYSLAGPEFYGAQVYVLDKHALALGRVPTALWFDTGATPTPEGTCALDKTCWYSIQPARPINLAYDLRANGMEHFLSALDFHGTGDNRIAYWAMTNTNTLRTASPRLLLSWTIVPVKPYIMPPRAGQKNGDIPLGIVRYGATQPGPIDAVDDRMNQVVYAAGYLWAGLNTGAWVPKGDGTVEWRAAITYWLVRPVWLSGRISAVVARQEYVGVRSNDVVFPSIGVNGLGRGVLTFTLTGPNYFPSVGLARLDKISSPRTIWLSHRGIGPQDGFSEYTGSPRWGDYSAAVAKPLSNLIYFAAEYIGQTCTVATFQVDPTCGGTRSYFTNWGTGIGGIVP